MKAMLYFYAFLTGVINSAIGSGGGLICVPALKKYGLSQKNAQATTISIILPLTIISAFIYAINGDFSPLEAIKYIPFGILGSVIGVYLTRKIKNNFLRKSFALFMIWSGVRMIF